MAAPVHQLVELTQATAGELAAGADGLFDKPLRPESLAAFLDDPNHLLWYAVVARRPVGFASGSILLHPDKKPQMFINEVGVDAAYRRRGIGRDLVARLVEAARARGCDYAWLGTETDNEGGNACFGSVPAVVNAGPFVLYEWALDTD